MPRAFDSGEVARRQGNFMLQFTENVECHICDLVFEGEFVDLSGSMTLEDMAEPPTGTHTCPQCGHQWTSQATGWSFFSEPG